MQQYMKSIEYAKYRNVHRGQISKWIKQGRVILNEEGLVDIEVSDLILDAYSNDDCEYTNHPQNQRHSERTAHKKTTQKTSQKSKRGPQRGSTKRKLSKAPKDREAYLETLKNATSYAEERTALTRIKKEQEAIKLEKSKGLLIDATEVRKQAFECARLVRDRLFGIPDRLAPLLAAKTDAREIKEMLTGEIRIALEALCETEGGLSPDDDGELEESALLSEEDTDGEG